MCALVPDLPEERGAEAHARGDHHRRVLAHHLGRHGPRVLPGRNRVGADHVMLGTDNPAGGGIIGGTVRWIRERPYLSDVDKTNILGGNAAKLFGMKSA